MFEMFLLATREGFGQDILLPAGVFIVVIIWILNSLLNKWGYGLF